MADAKSKSEDAAERAYADAAEKKNAESVNGNKPAAGAEAAEPAKTEKPAEADAASTPKAPAKAGKTPAGKSKTRAARKKSAAKRKPAPTKQTPKTQLKDTVMTTAKNAKTTDFTKPVEKAAAEAQARLKTAYDKGSEMTAEATEFQKDNFEALVESGKIAASGMQDLGRGYVEDTRAAVETATADARKMAAVKSPSELFQLQGEIARRNFDAAIQAASKNTEAMMKLANEAFAPVSGRMSVAAEKISKAA